MAVREPDHQVFPKDGKRFTEEERQALVKKARPIFLERVAYYAPLMKVSPGRITVRTQKTRWGSCTERGNLNFNALLLLAPPEVLDSVVVHELCHLKYMNHSKYFYFELKRFYPEYKAAQAWLKENGRRLISMLPKEVLKRKRRRFFFFR